MILWSEYGGKRSGLPEYAMTAVGLPVTPDWWIFIDGEECIDSYDSREASLSDVGVWPIAAT